MTSRVKRYRASVVTAAKRYANDALPDTKAAAAAIQALYLAAVADDAKKLTIEIEEIEE
jgi:hypothetical protein